MAEMPADTPLVCTAKVPAERWSALTAAVETENDDGFRAYVQYFTEERFVGAKEADLRAGFKETALILVADDKAFADPTFPILCVDPDGHSPSFRVAVKDLWIVENNVSIGNLLFEEIVEDQVVDGRFVAE